MCETPIGSLALYWLGSKNDFLVKKRMVRTGETRVGRYAQLRHIALTETRALALLRAC